MKRMCILSPFHAATLLLLGTIHSWACSTNSTIITPLPTLGGSFLHVTALNGAGQMTGIGFLPGDAAMHAFLSGGEGISDLGSLGGTFSLGYAINASGQVAGESSVTDDAATRAFLHAGGTMIDLGTLGGSYSSAVALNNAGEVTGHSLTTDDLSFEAFHYSGGSMVSLGTLGGSFSVATDINELGIITGASSSDGDLETRAFLYVGGTMIDLGTLGGSYSIPAALNDANVVVGTSMLANGEFRAFVYSDGMMQDIGTLGGTFSSALAVNNASQVIGLATTANDAEARGFLYSNGVLTDLGTLGGNYTSPVAINNLGHIVGDSLTADGSTHAFLWQNGVMVDLNTLLSPDSGWVLNSARFINDAGRIVGIGIYNGVHQWFALDPGSDTANNPPVAAAGPDQNVNCQSEVTLDGSASSDPDGDTLSYQWSYDGNVFSTGATTVVLFDVGTYSITLTVTDPCGATSQDELIVTVADQTAPTVSAPAALTIQADANCQGVVPNVLAHVVATDNCTPVGDLVITQNPVAGALLGIGQHTITVTVTDASGNSATADVALTIEDATAPTISSLSVNPSMLWPPNGDLIPVTVTVVTSGSCDQSPISKIVSITSNEPVPAGSIQITGPLTAKLAALKTPSGNRRVYQITVRSTDASGNHTDAVVVVTVPKNMSGEEDTIKTARTKPKR